MRVEALASLAPVTPEQLSAALDLHRSQLSVWLNRALEEGRLSKLNKPVRYVWSTGPATRSPRFIKEF